MSDFVHLHCHTEYSLLDGAIRIGDLCSRAKDYGMSAAAITDHGNMYGALKFYLAAQKIGIKPIIGCELYVAATRHDDRDSADARKRYHLVLLAQNLVGYHNLIKLVSFGCLYGMHYKPRVDKALLAQHSEGLIALSACLAGEIPRKLAAQGMDAALAAAKDYAAIYPGRFYLELQSNGLAEQTRLNEGLIELAEDTGLPLVATNDCHYLTAEDVEAHDILLCIQTAACVDDSQRLRFETKELYYKTPEEMEAAFRHVPEALANTARIAAQCELELDLKTYHFPAYALPEGKTPEQEFADMSREGLTQRLARLPYVVDEAAYRERLALEIDVISKMGFAGYFLIVQDFINWGKRNKVPVGPGRGSAAGSLVAWALRITNLDPIPYNLLFERFLNNERVSMPDIDVDFCERRRSDVIDYVTRKYGQDSVAQITTFGTMKAKAVVRDVGRALGMSPSETDKIAKLIPNDLKMTIAKALEQEPELTTLYRTDPRITRLMDISRRLEGLCRHASTHAAGVVIGDRPLDEYLPLYRGKQNEIVTQFDMKMVEKVGLIKFDFLGLRTMTVIQDSLDLIAGQGKEVPDLDTLAFDDQATYDLYSQGDTDGVFQVESGGMRRYLRQLKPSCFDDLIAMLALYRPGPLGSGMVDEFIKRKHGEEPVTYPLPQLEETLKPTYGVIVYQEQVMKIAQVVASYTLGGADLLRRAMGKKDPAAMAKERSRFVDGALANDIDEAKANEIFDLMEKFAEYGFNKSHSAAYALISYYTAWLKTHFPTEFMAALLSSEVANQDKLLKYIFVCRERGIEVLPPSVNLSEEGFTVNDGRIVFGLGGIKNVGREAIREIIEQRSSGGPYASMLDLCVRVNLRKVTKRVVENLVKSGAMDCFGMPRAACYAAIETAVSRAQKKAREKTSPQLSLFSLSRSEPAPVMPGLGFSGEEQSIGEWTEDDKSRYEKESLGFFLTSHPLQTQRSKIRRLGLHTLEDIQDLPEGADVKIGLIVTESKERLNKKGEKWAVCQVEDLTGRLEMLAFSKVYGESKPLLETDQPLYVEARVLEDAQDGEEGARQLKLRLEKVLTLAEIKEPAELPVDVHLRASWIENDGLEAFKALLARHKGRAPVNVHLRTDSLAVSLELGPNFAVNASETFELELRQWCATAEAGHA